MKLPAASAALDASNPTFLFQTIMLVVNPDKQPLWQSPRKLLLLDFVGATMTSLTTGLLLATEILPIGLPSWLLFAMSLVAACFACFDIACYLLVRERAWPLAVIGMLNLGYCFGVLTICSIYFRELSTLGIIYFAGEAAIVVPLACWELWIASRSHAYE